MHKGPSPHITGLSAEALAELDRLLDAEGVGGDARTIAPRDATVPTPMSFSQELLWLLDRATPGLTAYNLPLARRLRGTLDVPALERALTAVASRHEALRTRFADVDGHPVQVIDAPSAVKVHQLDMGDVSREEREREAERVVRERARTSIDLANEPSFRVTLVRLADDDHVLLIETHHIVVDGWSIGIIFRELAVAYAAARAGREAEFAPLPIQFGDFAAWQREQLAGERLNELLAFWRTQLGSAANEPLALPTDFARPSTPTFSGARQTVVLSGTQLAAIKRFAQASDATLYMTLLSAYASVLHRYTGRADVLMGSGSAGRSLPETEGIVGYLNSTLVQRGDFAGDPTFAELLARVRASAVGALDHQDMPLEKLVLELRQGQERLSHAPLFEVVLTMQDTMGGAMSLEGVIVEPFGVDFGATKFDITLLVSERADELALTAQYRSDLYAPETMRRFLGHVVQVLDAAATNASVRVSAMPVMTDTERAELKSWNDTAADEGTATTFVELFEAQASRVGDREAVAGALTYTALNARANQLAHQLRSSGVTVGAPVGLLLDRSSDAIVGLVGILKSGGAYVPLSVDAPAARLATQIAECRSRIVVTSVANADRLPGGVTAIALDREADAAVLNAQPTTNPANAASPDSLAYVLFTSGSTGTPKGVAVTHANAVHYARAVSRVLANTLERLDGLQFALVSTLAADLGNTSLLPSLLSGGTLHVLAQDATTDPARFADYMKANAVDVLKITPNHLAALTAGRTGRDLASVLPKKWVIVGGEALRPDVARTLLGAGTCRVLNHYGPTETTVGVCTFEVTTDSLDRVLAAGAQTIPVGQPLPNTRAYIIDGNNNDMPVGVPGELVIGGAGVAQGYFHRDDLTAERFVSLRGDRVYRTGDRARRLPDGSIEFLGRADDQVKVRGYRVELGEIEQVLRGHSAVANSTVMLRTDEGTEPRLVAYVVAKQAGYEVAHAERLSADTLREWLVTHLPEYMVPSAVVLLDSIPLTANGKIDRNRLPIPGDDTTGAEQKYVAPRNDVETQLAAIWAEVLKKERVGVTDNFLDLGGHSLMAIRVLGKISKTFSVRLPLRTLFDSPTVEQIAVVIATEKAVAAPVSAIGARSRDAFRIGTDGGTK